MNKLMYYVSESFDPYWNLAVEKYLTFHTQPGACILYLWQNASTVVIGKNQNAYKECHCRLLEREGGHLARRLSGGGAVFHDLGNLNFTFCVRKPDYDVHRQLSVLIEALRQLGICGEITGRNDVTVDGRKISGNAFYCSGDFCYHHGTILVNVDMDRMGRYLNASAQKLKSKGVDSVRARVVNVCECLRQTSAAAGLEPSGQKAVNISDMCRAMQRAFACIYGAKAEEPTSKPERIELSGEALELIEKEARIFASPQWIYGDPVTYTYEFSKRFSWGEIQVCLDMCEGRVRAVKVYSDALDPELAKNIETAVIKQRYTQLPPKVRSWLLEEMGDFYGI